MSDLDETARRLAGRSYYSNVNINSVQIDGIDMRDYPDFCDAYIEYAEWDDGEELTDDEIYELGDLRPELAHELIHENQLYI